MREPVAKRFNHINTHGWQGILLFVTAIWVVFLVDLFLPLERFGLIPRHFIGLIGIFTMPFLHGNWPHLVNNSISLIFLLFLLVGSRDRAGWITGQIILMSGGLLWVFGRSAIHIGASGLVFGLIAYLIFAGLYEKRLITAMIAVLVGLFYGGSLVTGILPGQAGVSWDGHLCGTGAGFFISRWKAGK